ncbi:hypothetical protein [Mycoplasmopsis glycophila]|uniref:Uncharacterized protein n=1 Tax=Mycoplasmopsis glycophila TaxID=171285 RepID=A0A449AV59_9BACT|nr:hypothetical protein [Mycoplasmopsis glycophila]VEU70352.1 Uncharacterised protein [Mycoplasmopsis glycophila]
MEDVLRHLIAKNNKVSLIIGSNHYQLINNFKLEIQNNYKFDLKINETKLNERTAIDLTKISIPALNLNNKREFKDIQNEIILYVSNYFASFNLFWNYDYYIENINNPLFLKGLVNDLENTINIKIKSLNKKSNGETSLIVNNTLTELLTEKEQEKWNKIIEEFTNKVIGEAKKEPDYNPETSITDVLNNNTEIANKVDKDGINLISNDDLVKILDNNIINLNDFKVPLLRTYYDNSVDLANAIWDHINQNLTVKFTVNEYEFNQALKQLLIPSRENKTQLIIRGLYGFSSGVIPFEIINTTTENASYDNAISIKNDNNIINIIEEENKIQKQKAARNKKIWLGLTGGTALLGLISAGFIVWIRRFRNKLK